MLQLRGILDAHAAHHELVTLLDAEATRLDGRTPAEQAAPFLRGLEIPETTRAAIEEVFNLTQRSVGTKVESALDADPPDLETFLRDPISLLHQTLEFGAEATAFVAELAKLASLPGATDYMMALSMATTTGYREPLFMTSALIVVVSATEVRLKSIIRRFVEMKSNNPPEAERRRLLSRLFRGGLDKWEVTFRDELGLELRSWSNEWDRVVEIFARRHAHVHQGGFVDAAYRTTTGSIEPIGMPLFLQVDYLNEAIDVLTGFSFGALLGTWSDAKPAIRVPVAGVLGQYVHDPLRDGCFLLVEQMTSIVEANAVNDAERAQAKVNRMLALEGRLGADAIAAELDNWDTSELTRDYELARLILSGRDGEARPLFDALRASGELSDKDVSTWSRFRRWRDDGTVSAP